MFVSIIRDGHQSLYECVRMHMRPLDRDHEIAIDLECSQPFDSRTLVVDKRTTVVEVKNHDGRPIDTYDWPAAYQAARVAA